MLKRTTVGILIFDDVEVLDYCGPYEVFCSVRLNEEKRREEPSPFNVLLVAEKADLVRNSGGMRTLPDVTTADCPQLDILLVPGGWGTRREINNKRLLKWIAQRAAEVATLTSVCTGSMLLGKAGLLAGRQATTHWKSLLWMKESFPDVIVEEQQHVVRDGNLFTSAGISAGIDLALLVTAEYYGEAIARSTARHMEYPYPENLKRRI
ncbi:MAG: DJ-1/PfpI family protein [Desulfuromonadaceae bacterium]|nr:DJ-1/PfpI family protein [Desulfuromonadaceae bacterium]MDD5105675.1 DJ-1/PfpI family protein [Desulfuromonadaceae bacterium]